MLQVPPQLRLHWARAIPGCALPLRSTQKGGTDRAVFNVQKVIKKEMLQNGAAPHTKMSYRKNIMVWENHQCLIKLIDLLEPQSLFTLMPQGVLDQLLGSA